MLRPVGEAGRGALPMNRPPRLLIFGITVTGILNNTLVGPSIPDILADFDRSQSAAGPLVASASLPGIVVAPLIGLAADRFGRRAVLLPCLWAFGIFGVVNAIAPTYELMLASRVAQGFGAAGLINLAVVLISDHWEGAERTALIGRNAAVLTMSLAVAPALGGAVSDLFGWRVAFGGYALAIPMAVVAGRVLRADRPTEAETVRAQVTAARRAVGHPVVKASLVSGVLVFVLIFGGFLTAFPLLMEQDYGLGAAQRGLLIAVPAASASLVAFNLGRIRSSLPLRGLLVGAGCTYLIAFGLVAATGPIVVLVVASILYGLGEGVFLPSLQDAVAEAAPPERRGAVIAVWVGAARLGQTIGPLLASLALTATDPGGVFAIGAGLCVVLLALQVLGPIGRRTPPVAVAPPL